MNSIQDRSFSLLHFLDRVSVNGLLLMGVITYGLAAILNPGFIASDEYWHSIIRYIPAQKASLLSLMDLEDIRSALQNLPMHLAAQTALLLGEQSPYMQYIWSVILIGIGNGLLMAKGALVFSEHWQPRERKVLLACLFLYGIAPFLLTRPMFESLAAPWVFLSLAYLTRYDDRPDRETSSLLIAVLCISIAFALRPQVGACALAIPMIALIQQRWAHFVWTLLLGSCAFIVIGILDSLWRGSFHGSLWAILDYNLAHGHEYGTRPWYFYLPLCLALLFAPLTFSVQRFRRLGQELRSLRSTLLLLGLFLVSHMFFSNKFERFLIPMVPVFVFLIAKWLIVTLKETQPPYLRLSFLALINLLILTLGLTQIPQRNLLGMAQLLASNSEISRILSYRESLGFVPSALAREKEIYIEQISQAIPEEMDCGTWLVLRASDVPRLESELEKFSLVAHLQVNWVESLIQKLNPANNQRRSSLSVFGCKSPILRLSMPQI